MAEQIINVSVSRELWKEVGIRAILEGKDKKDILDKALREYLNNKEVK